MNHASLRTVFGSIAAAFLLSGTLAAQAADMPAIGSETNDDIVEIELPPPHVTEIDAGGFSATTYSLTGPDTVEQFQVRASTPEKSEMVIYDFKNEKARYFILHVNNGVADLTPIAIKPFWDINAEELAHAQVMGCKAAMELKSGAEGMDGFNSYAEMSKQYLKTYCPHP